VQKGVAPDSIVAAGARQGKVERTRPLCPYGKVAKYKGSGSTDAAENIECAVQASAQ
jgi:feruloyl esterase